MKTGFPNKGLPRYQSVEQTDPKASNTAPKKTTRSERLASQDPHANSSFKASLKEVAKKFFMEGATSLKENTMLPKPKGVEQSTWDAYTTGTGTPWGHLAKGQPVAALKSFAQLLVGGKV